MGLDARDDQLKGRILHYCPYYDVLAPVMMKSTVQDVHEVHSSSSTTVVDVVQVVVHDKPCALNESTKIDDMLTCNQDENGDVEIISPLSEVCSYETINMDRPNAESSDTSVNACTSEDEQTNCETVFPLNDQQAAVDEEESIESAKEAKIIQCDQQDADD